MKPIPQSPGYFAHEDGRIWSSKSGKYLKLLPTNSGYLKFHAYYGKRGSMKNIYVHIAVCTAFYGLPPDTTYEVRHLDNNPHNNNVGNLCWGTSKENHQDQVLHGTDPKGERNPYAKLSNEDILNIRSLYNTVKVKTLAEMYKTHPSNIRKIINRRVWQHI